MLFYVVNLHLNFEKVISSYKCIIIIMIFVRLFVNINISKMDTHYNVVG